MTLPPNEKPAVGSIPTPALFTPSIACLVDRNPFDNYFGNSSSSVQPSLTVQDTGVTVRVESISPPPPPQPQPQLPQADTLHQTSTEPSSATRSPAPSASPTLSSSSSAASTSTSSTSKRKAKTAAAGVAPPPAKREKFLERNRQAASKCRQKKREWLTTLESDAKSLQDTNTQLLSTAHALRNEILTLRATLLRHKSCGCPSVPSYLAAVNAPPSTSDPLMAPVPEIVIPPMPTILFADHDDNYSEASTDAASPGLHGMDTPPPLTSLAL
ncbi:hypothetical protein RI367_002183 [Sorochytrium milnesiophthora]